MLKEPPTDHRAQIRASGLALFASDGVAAVSVARICREARVANGTFYNFYRNKSELVAEFLKEAYGGLASRLRVAETTNGTPEEDHRKDVQIIVDFTLENRSLLSIALRDPDALRLTQHDVKEMFVKQRTDAFKRGMDAGFYREGIDARILARSETAIMTDVLLDWLDDERRLDRAELIEQLVRVRLRLTNGITSAASDDA